MTDLYTLELVRALALARKRQLLEVINENRRGPLYKTMAEGTTKIVEVGFNSLIDDINTLINDAKRAQ